MIERKYTNITSKTKCFYFLKWLYIITVRALNNGLFFAIHAKQQSTVTLALCKSPGISQKSPASINIGPRSSISLSKVVSYTTFFIASHRKKSIGDKQADLGAQDVCPQRLIH